MNPDLRDWTFVHYFLTTMIEEPKDNFPENS